MHYKPLSDYNHAFVHRYGIVRLTSLVHFNLFMPILTEGGTVKFAFNAYAMFDLLLLCSISLYALEFTPS